jgi:hypothetical protein
VSIRLQGMTSGVALPQLDTGVGVVGVFARPRAPEWSGNPGSDGYKRVVYDYATYIHFKVRIRKLLHYLDILNSQQPTAHKLPASRFMLASQLNHSVIAETCIRFMW